MKLFYEKTSKLILRNAVQQLEPEFWIGWNDVIIEEAHNGNIRPLIEELVKRLKRMDVK